MWYRSIVLMLLYFKHLKDLCTAIKTSLLKTFFIYFPRKNNVTFLKSFAEVTLVMKQTY